MHIVSKWLLVALIVGFSIPALMAQACPGRPAQGTVVNDPFSISSVSGAINAQMTLGNSVDQYGYTHYCYNYNAAGVVVEAPTFRLNPGDVLNLKIINQITEAKDTRPEKMKMAMRMPSPAATCGDGGEATINSTNVHFHGLNVPPICHQDDVINTMIQPGTPGFQYNVQIPANEPPGLYWYHPHIHGFTEFQVNGGAAGAIIVEGMQNYRPEVKGLAERVFVIRQQYLVPWIPGPYQLTINYETAPPTGQAPVIQMAPGEKQFWRVANASLQDFLELQVIENNKPVNLQMIALDGYPLAKTRLQTTILVPPAGRAEFIVQAPAVGGTGYFYTQSYSTGPTGNADTALVISNIQLTTKNDSATKTEPPVKPAATPATLSAALATAPPPPLKFSNLAQQPVTTQRKLFFSEEFGGTNGPIEFYITVNGQKEQVFEPNEKPVITTKVGAVEEWTIENRALETHAFHIHQIHFQILEVDGVPVTNSDLRDTIEIPYWSGTGPYHSVKLSMDFRDPTTAGTFLFHCHILLHEDLGMMHKILVKP